MIKNSIKSTPTNPAISKLIKRQKAGFFVCVGLDSDMKLLPEKMRQKGAMQGVFEFNKKIIDATASYSCAFKPNSAFYEAEGVGGLRALEKTFDYLRNTKPDLLTILDAKRADIGSTNSGYTKMAFDTLGVDSLTIAPYMGGSVLEGGERRLASLAPFLERRDKLIFALCRTSNEDAGEFQDLPISLKNLSSDYKSRFGNLKDLSEIVGSDTVPLYMVVAYKLSRDWNMNRNLGLVVGATYPEELALIRKVAPDLPILAPGFGFQGGNTKLAVKNGLNRERLGLIVNSSRGIIFAGRGKDGYGKNFAHEAGVACQELHYQIKSYI